MSIKDVLKKQTSIPESIEKQLPTIAPKISKILYAVADSLPNISNPKLGKSSTTPKLREFVSSIEEKMPDVFPRFVTGTEPYSESKIVRTGPISRAIEVETPVGFPVYSVDKRGTVDINSLLTTEE